MNRMAKREVFLVSSKNEFLKEQVQFDWARMKDKQQRKQISVKNLHNAYLQYNEHSQILEVSTASQNKLGKAASAFNLDIKTTHGIFTVEQLFQASKNFELSGTNEKLLYGSSQQAKKSVKHKQKNDRLINFKLFGHAYPLTPKTLFYNYLYCNAMWQNPELAMQIVKYDVFTDINFNDKYGINCQAEACSIFTSLCRKLELEKALSSFNNFKKLVYGKQY
ncbi:DarT1-associated NADAR antitoxin family protein [Apilactobacillus micheneri]|uniref:DarT1-associated NADAR antitoxin family protein n=1 Tax=Apilactobacillus micheneri TaxID=1899430 RepID=UPI0011266B72|nr:hypothetical protein [Apilactobacillus micheneri]